MGIIISWLNTFFVVPTVFINVFLNVLIHREGTDAAGKHDLKQYLPGISPYLQWKAYTGILNNWCSTLWCVYNMHEVQQTSCYIDSHQLVLTVILLYMSIMRSVPNGAEQINGITSNLNTTITPSISHNEWSLSCFASVSCSYISLFLVDLCD